MKKKLFAVALVVSFYMLFVFAFTGTGQDTKVAQVFTDLGLSDATAIASTSTTQSGPADVSLKANFRDPMPPPLRKPKPRRNKRKRR